MSFPVASGRLQKDLEDNRTLFLKITIENNGIK
jgi:hypothetical protein